MTLVLMPAVVVGFCLGTASRSSGLLMAVIMVIMIMVILYRLGGGLIGLMVVVMFRSGNDGEG
jgi:hypothetical protein